MLASAVLSYRNHTFLWVFLKSRICKCYLQLPGIGWGWKGKILWVSELLFRVTEEKHRHDCLNTSNVYSVFCDLMVDSTWIVFLGNSLFWEQTAENKVLIWCGFWKSGPNGSFLKVCDPKWSNVGSPEVIPQMCIVWYSLGSVACQWVTAAGLIHGEAKSLTPFQKEIHFGHCAVSYTALFNGVMSRKPFGPKQ